MTFASLISEFEMWSGRTGWSDADLFDRLKASMSLEYLERLSFFENSPTTYTELREKGLKIDKLLQDLKNTQTRTPQVSRTSAPTP